MQYAIWKGSLFLQFSFDDTRNRHDLYHKNTMGKRLIDNNNDKDNNSSK